RRVRLRNRRVTRLVLVSLLPSQTYSATTPRGREGSQARVTVRNPANPRSRAHGSPRILAPLLLVTTTVVVAGCLRSSGATDLPSAAVARPTPVAMPTSTPTPMPAAGLGVDDPRLGMNVLVSNS